MASLTVTARNVRPLPGHIGREFTAGGSGTVGDLVYLASDGDVEVTDANAAGTSQALGIVTAAGTEGATTFAAGDRVYVVEYGPVAGFSGMTPYGGGWVSETAGDIADAAPSTASAVVNYVGFAESAQVFFMQCRKTAYQNAIASLTDSSGGSADNTVAAITQAANAGSADVGPVKDGFADVAAKINAILAALRANGILVN